MVEFLGGHRQTERALSFGRQADVVLDPYNQHLHGQAGRFVRDGERWFLENVGAKLHLRLSTGSGFLAELPPGTSTALQSGQGWVRVTAGPTTYELGYLVLAGRRVTPLGPGSDTISYGRGLTPAQIDYAVTLAEPRLLGRPGPLPTHRAIAARWGVQPRTVAKTFEDIRARLRADGVRAIDSQDQLVEHLVVNRIITLADLEAAALDHPDGPIRRTS